MPNYVKNDFARWDSILADGCSDPFWPDGVNMNLVRRHIINDYDLLAVKKTEKTQISLFDDEEGELQEEERPVPPMVSDNFMSPTGKHPDRLLNRWTWPILTNNMTVNNQ